MILTARRLTAWQQCRRRYLLEQGWLVRRWRPKVLFDACLREGIAKLSMGADADVVAIVAAARARFLSAAADPGLDLPHGRDAYREACDWTAMLGTTLTAISRLTLLVLHPLSAVRLAPGVEWQPTALADDSGTLHRWLTVDAWDADAIARECHSWYALGDMLAADSPLQLHIVVIGQMRDGRRISPWCRAYLHPMLARELRFQKSNPKGGHMALAGDKWKPTWLADMPRMTAAAWCDRMAADGVTPSLLLHPSIAQPTDIARQQLLTEIEEEAWRIVEEEDRAARKGSASGGTARRPAFPATTPGARASCDGLVPCPWQAACWRAEWDVPVEELGPYARRHLPGADSGASARSSRQAVVVA